MKNPFPGMNPWLEEFWRDVHAHLLVYASDQLNTELPPDLRARVDERLAVAADEEKPRTYLPDVAMTLNNLGVLDETQNRPGGSPQGA